MLHRRRGLSAVVVALAFVVFLTVVAFLQQELSLQTMSDVHRGQLFAVARLQAVSAVDELVAAATREANVEGEVFFGMLRWRLDEPWDDMDVTDWLPAPGAPVEPRWGNAVTGATGEARARVLSHRARIHSGRPCRDPLGTEEKAAVLEFTVETEARDGAGRVRRRLTGAYELRILLMGPPRPFDQLGLFLGSADAVLDTRRINQRREQAIQGHLALRDRLRAIDPAGLPPDDVLWLSQIIDGMVEEDELRMRLPELPEGRTCMLGFAPGVREFRLEELDLEHELDIIQARLDARRAAYGSMSGVTRPRLEQLYWMVDEYSNLFDRLWQIGEWVTTVIGEDSDRYRRDIEPYLPRLDPAYFLDRVTLRPREQEPFFHMWRARSIDLEGVIDLRHFSFPIELEGEVKGRVVLLVGPAGARLRDLNWRANQELHRLVVVSMGGDVRIEGKVAASVLMLGRPDGDRSPGHLRMGLDARLRGSLLLPLATRNNVTIRGTLAYDRQLRAAYPPRRTLDRGTRGEYLVVINQRPLWMKEEPL